MLPIRTILFPTDYSDQSHYAFQVASALARDYAAKLVVLHVAEPFLPIVTDGGMMIPPTVDVQALREQLRHIRPDDPKVECQHRLAEGDAALEILRTAAEMKCDLIVIGTHGRTGLGRLLLGSVAEHVLRKACCPVLTVKAPQQIKATEVETVAALADEQALVPV